MQAEQFAQAVDGDVVARAEAVLIDAMFDDIVAGIRLRPVAAGRVETDPVTAGPDASPRGASEGATVSPDDGPIRSPPSSC